MLEKKDEKGKVEVLYRFYGFAQNAEARTLVRAHKLICLRPYFVRASAKNEFLCKAIDFMGIHGSRKIWDNSPVVCATSRRVRDSYRKPFVTYHNVCDSYQNHCDSSPDDWDRYHKAWDTYHKAWDSYQTVRDSYQKHCAMHQNVRAN